MAINWETIAAIAVTQSISTVVTFYTIKILNGVHEHNGNVRVKSRKENTSNITETNQSKRLND